MLCTAIPVEASDTLIKCAKHLFFKEPSDEDYYERRSYKKTYFAAVQRRAINMDSVFGEMHDSKDFYIHGKRYHNMKINIVLVSCCMNELWSNLRLNFVIKLTLLELVTLSFVTNNNFVLVHKQL